MSLPRPDGGMHGPITLWHGIVNDAVYVRSACGAQAEWFRCARKAGAGLIELDGVTRAVRFQIERADALHNALDEALHRKCDTFGTNPVTAITSVAVRGATLLITPAGELSNPHGRTVKGAKVQP